MRIHTQMLHMECYEVVFNGAMTDACRCCISRHITSRLAARSILAWNGGFMVSLLGHCVYSSVLLGVVVNAYHRIHSSRLALLIMFLNTLTLSAVIRKIIGSVTVLTADVLNVSQ